MNTRSGCFLACSAIHCCFVYVFVELRVSSSGSHQWVCTNDAPLPSSGSRWPRFPAFTGTIKALRLPAPHGLRLIDSPSGSAGCLPCLCPPKALPPPCRLGDGPGSTLLTLAYPSQRSRPRARAGSPRFPDDPYRDSAPGPRPRTTRCASPLAALPVLPPGHLTPKASSIPISRLPPPLHHLLSTLHVGRCRASCKTRFRLAGCAFAGRESNPLDRYERFQFHFIAFSSPGLSLEQ